MVVAGKKAALLVGTAILLWVTDFAHHLPPAMIALGVGLFALLPPVGILDEDDMRNVNYMPVFFVAAAISMGNVLEATKGLDVLTTTFFTSVEPFLGNIFSTTVIMYWTGFIYHFFLASEISMLGTSMPLVMQFAKQHDMNALMLGLLWTSRPAASCSPINRACWCWAIPTAISKPATWCVSARCSRWPSFSSCCCWCRSTGR